tara:strand:- start:174206 stop:174364 length:159 start_codon:yes stop_codon:yes gene_type:complete
MRDFCAVHDEMGGVYAFLMAGISISDFVSIRKIHLIAVAGRKVPLVIQAGKI